MHAHEVICLRMAALIRDCMHVKSHMHFRMVRFDSNCMHMKARVPPSFWLYQHLISRACHMAGIGIPMSNSTRMYCTASSSVPRPCMPMRTTSVFFHNIRPLRYGTHTYSMLLGLLLCMHPMHARPLCFTTLGCRGGLYSRRTYPMSVCLSNWWRTSHACAPPLFLTMPGCRGGGDGVQPPADCCQERGTQVRRACLSLVHGITYA
jgi:hypothetical protein